MTARILPGTALSALIVVSGVLLAGCASSSGTPTNTPTTTHTTTPSGTPTKISPPPEGACSIDQLQVTLGQPQGTAGSSIVPIIFANTGSSECMLSGFPKVAFVGDGNGTQLGAPAKDDTSAPVVENNLKPGQSASAPLKIAEAGNYGDQCTVVPADGFRVYPPHSQEAVFVKDTSFKACSNANVVLLTVKPVAPAS